MTLVMNGLNFYSRESWKFVRTITCILKHSKKIHKDFLTLYPVNYGCNNDITENIA